MPWITAKFPVTEFEYLDNIFYELERRYNAYVNLKENFSFLTTIDKLSTSTQRVTEKAQSLVRYYSNDLEDDLVQECIHFCSHVFSNKTVKKP